jgi:hypothetical protein
MITTLSVITLPILSCEESWTFLCPFRLCFHQQLVQ